MDKKIWSKPEVEFVSFAANDYISTCLAAYSGTLYCALPDDPNYIGDYQVYEDQREVFQEPNGWMGHNGHANHGSCDWGAEFSCEGNNSFGVEGFTKADVWSVQIGEEVSGRDAFLDYRGTATTIGQLVDNLSESSVGKWFKAFWNSGDLTNGGTWRHFGLAYIDSVTVAGNPNRS